MARPHEIRLPVQDSWIVAGANSGAALNLRADPTPFEHMVDLVQKVNGKEFDGDPAKNESYHCYGQDIIAPVRGEVIQSNGSFADNPPADLPDLLPNQLGNHIIIKHPDMALYSLMAHLKKDSIKVRAGTIVEQGQPIAECGNSGLSYAPHLAYAVLLAYHKPGTIFNISTARTVQLMFQGVRMARNSRKALTMAAYYPLPDDAIEHREFRLFRVRRAGSSRWRQPA